MVGKKELIPERKEEKFHSIGSVFRYCIKSYVTSENIMI